MPNISDLYVCTDAQVTVVTSTVQPGVIGIGTNPSRKFYSVFNDSPNTLYLKLGGSGSFSNNYTVKIPGGAYFETPWPPIFTGSVWVSWTAASGTALFTEYV